MKNEIHGKVHHTPPENELDNLFAIVGQYYQDGQKTGGPRQSVTFSLLDPARVPRVLELLLRTEKAVAKWVDGEKTGMLHLSLKPATTASEAKSDDLNGRERQISVKDLVRSIQKTKEAAQERAPAPKPPERDEDSSASDRGREMDPPSRSKDVGMDR